MYPLIFCTLVLGQNYCELARQLAGDLACFAPGTHLLVLTDHPGLFRDVDNVEAVFHRRRSVAGFNDKLSVVKKALDRAETCLFMDADMRILDTLELDPLVFAPGIKSYHVFSWQYFQDRIKAGEQNWDRRLDQRIMAFQRANLRLETADADIPVVREFLFALTRCPQLEAFLQKWNEIAETSEKNGMFSHEGFTIGLAALLTGLPVAQHDFAGLHFFEPLISLDAVEAGRMTPAQYDTLEASINAIKHSAGRANPLALKRLAKALSFLRVKVFGLDLLR